jgi:hypothetical protein
MGMRQALTLDGNRFFRADLVRGGAPARLLKLLSLLSSP